MKKNRIVSLLMLFMATTSIFGQRQITIGPNTYNVADVKSITTTYLSVDQGSFMDVLSKHPEYSIFYEALQKTGLADTLSITSKSKTYDYYLTKPTDKSGNRLYCPSECNVGFTVFAETDEVFRSEGINSFDDLKKCCVQWYEHSDSWYDYIKEKGITVSTGTDYTNRFNVVNMFMAYHILRGAMAIDKIVYEKSVGGYNWNMCFGYEPQEYFETLLPHTLLKVWELNPKTTRDLYLNRYRQNNTLTDEIGTFGSDATHPIMFRGVSVNRENSLYCSNGFVHSIKSTLLYNETAVKSQQERMRFDIMNILPEMADNGIRFATNNEISVRNRYQTGESDGNRVAFDNTYFDNLVCYNPNTLLRFCVTGAWRANNSSQLQGWDAYDYALKLPPVPTGQYELRIIYPPMTRGGIIQYYLGRSSKQDDMVPLGGPLDACADPSVDGNPMGCEYISSDCGVVSDRVMHQRGYMRAPASFSRGSYNSITDKLTYDPSDIYSAARNISGRYCCRSEWGYGTMMLRRIVGTVTLRQGEDYWLRIKNLMNDANLGWTFDFVELCPVSVSKNSDMMEDWY